MIGEKLAQAGIKKEVAEIALEALEQDEKEVALALWTRRFGDVPKDDKERQRQIRFLLSRGFHLGDAFKLVPRAAPMTTDTERDPRAKFGNSGSSVRANLAERAARFSDPDDAANATSASDPDEPSEPIELTRTSQTKSLSPNKPRSSFGRSRPWGRKNEDK
jgi:hypothetical protein